MIGHQHGRHVHRVDAARAQALDDGNAGLCFVLTGNLRLAELLRAGDLAEEVIGMRGAQGRYATAGLRPDCGPGRVRVHDATDGRELAIELKMGWQIGRGAQCAFEHTALPVDHHHVVLLHARIGNAAGFDDDRAAGGIARTDIAPGEIDQAELGQFQIGFEHLLFQ